MKEKINAKQKYNPVLIKSSEQFINNKKIFGDGTGDWPEDFQYENGNYTCKCSVCKQKFSGHKRRIVCKVCAEKTIEVNEQEYERLLSIEKKYNKINKWYWDKPL